MKGFRETANKAGKIDKEKAKNGIWKQVPGMDIEFLVRPISIHNRELQQKIFDTGLYKKINDQKPAITDNERKERAEEIAEAYFGTVIIDARVTAEDAPEDEEPFTNEELEWFILNCLVLDSRSKKTIKCFQYVSKSKALNF